MLYCQFPVARSTGSVLGETEMDQMEDGNKRGVENQPSQFPVPYLLSVNCKFNLIKNKINFGHLGYINC